MEIFSQAFFHDVSTTSVPLTSLKQNGCYCGREGFLCAGINEDELHYSCTASFQKTMWHKRMPGKKISISPLRYYANCVSTTLTVLILHNVESVYFFYTNPVFIYIYNNHC
jgi:hypothetical protein